MGPDTAKAPAVKGLRERRRRPANAPALETTTATVVLRVVRPPGEALARARDVIPAHLRRAGRNGSGSEGAKAAPTALTAADDTRRKVSAGRILSGRSHVATGRAGARENGTATAAMMGAIAASVGALDPVAPDVSTPAAGTSDASGMAAPMTVTGVVASMPAGLGTGRGEDTSLVTTTGPTKAPNAVAAATPLRPDMLARLATAARPTGAVGATTMVDGATTARTGMTAADLEVRRSGVVAPCRRRPV